ncbi:hypothetical protein QWZ06_15590 [Chryseobacterium tructae]|uniref:Uncharacterized protein n=1 Tax=Chryseobacterium tructae TaxID=1037380 RepID=A0ABV7XZ69_9FLAO|nr:hypothetical protein [Chryseobacterium tructae]MDN3693608.1 hypothetical protein [Chryseobacterium tructae]
MNRFHFIFVPILLCISQCFKAQGRPVEVVKESENINNLCIGNKNYCCNYAAMKINNNLEENHELIVTNPKPSYSNAFLGSILIIVSLFILRTLSKRIEE